MTLSKIEFKPGIIKDDSQLAAEGGYVSSDKMRGWRGKMQTIGGWQLLTTDTFTSPARGAHDWTDLDGNPILAWGTATHLYALVGGAVVDITPPLTAGVLGTPFSTQNGSTTVLVKHPLHGLATGNTITFSNATPIAGLTLNGTFPVSVLDQDQYTIVAPSAANATITSGAGSTVDYTAPLPAGNVDAQPVGYGSGTYGTGPYGASQATDTDPRVWALDNFGDALMAVPRGGGLYEWPPSFRYPELLLNGDFATDTVWAKGTGWAISGGTATKTAGTASLLSQNVANLVEPGRVYRVTFDVTVTAGTLKFRNNAGSPTPAVIDVNGASGFGASTPITRSGTYSRTFRAPASIVDIVFAADAAFAGSIDNVSLKMESKAYRIEEAPRNIGWMFVDPARFVVLLSTQGLDGVYNPLLVRWCDQENNRIWIPDIGTNANLAGEYPLGQGGQAVSGLTTRQQNLIWTDSALYSMRFTGSADTVFSFSPIGSGAGILGRNAAVENNGAVFWLARSGFYIFQGSIPQKIDCPMERDILDHISDLNVEKIYAGINGQFSEVWFCYPDNRDGVECSKVAVYNYIEQHWATHTFDRTSWISAGVFPNPIGFSALGRIFEHETGQSNNGGAIVGHLETSYFDVEDGEHLMNILRVVLDFAELAGPVSITLFGRPWPNGPEWSWGPYPWGLATQKLDLRRTARQMKIRIDFANNPTFFRLGASRIDAQKSGALR